METNHLNTKLIDNTNKQRNFFENTTRLILVAEVNESEWENVLLRVTC